MFRIVIADWRKILLFYLAGTALWLIIHFLIVQEFANHCCLHDPTEQPRILKLLLLELVYCSCSTVFWAQTGMYERCRLQLTETLPLSPDALNLTRILACAVHFAPTLINWVVVFATWRHFDLAIPVWVPVLTLLLLLGYVLLCLRYLTLRYVLPVFFPLLFIPEIENRFPEVLGWSATPWPSLILAVAIVLFGWLAVRQPLPRWTRR
jgi:hypothetical protein